MSVNFVLRLALVYLIAGAICFALTQTPIAFFYPLLWTAIALAWFVAMAVFSVAIAGLCMWLGLCAASQRVVIKNRI